MEAAAALRVPPHSVQAEQAVLGGLMLAPEALCRVQDWLAPEDFYRRDHRLIYESIRALDEKGRPADAVTMGEWFEAQGQLHLVGDGAYLFELANTTPSAANITGYAEIVRDKALARRIIEAGTEIVNAGFDQGFDPDQALATAQTLVQSLAPSQTGGLAPASSSLKDWFSDLRHRYELGSTVTGLATPWDDFNRATHGLQDGDLIVLGGRPNMGKSIAGLNIAECAASTRHVAVFSLEMTRNQLHRRGISAAGRIPHDWLLAPTDADDYWAQVTEAVRQRKSLHLSIDDTPSITINQLMARARALHMRDPIRLLVVDHIHDFKIDAKLARFEYGAIAQGLKTLAKEFNCPVVALAQLNRALSSRAEKRPTMADLRESGEIEQKADMIVFIHREDYYDRETHLKGVVELILAKGRDIESGRSIYLANDFAHMALRNLEGPLPMHERPAMAGASGRSRYFGRKGGQAVGGDD